VHKYDTRSAGHRGCGSMSSLTSSCENGYYHETDGTAHRYWLNAGRYTLNQIDGIILHFFTF
jgi:hypothetical protein